MTPVFALVMAVLWAPLPLLQARHLASESLQQEHREALERRATGPGALLFPAGAALLVLVAAWFAVRAGSDTWWMWLLAGVLFVVNVLLGLRVRRQVTGRWLGGTKQTGRRALATRLGVLAGVIYVGTYILMWSVGEPAATWVTVLGAVLLGVSVLLGTSAGILLLLAMQEEATAEWERDRDA